MTNYPCEVGYLAICHVKFTVLSPPSHAGDSKCEQFENKGGAPMPVNDHIAAFAQGWTEGKIDMIMKSLSKDFELDDPNAGRIQKADIPRYFEALVGNVTQIRGDGNRAPLMEMSEVVIKDDVVPVTVWTWWTVPGTPLAGSALVKVGEDGVLSERLTYSTALGAG